MLNPVHRVARRAVIDRFAAAEALDAEHTFEFHPADARQQAAFDSLVARGFLRLGIGHGHWFDAARWHRQRARRRFAVGAAAVAGAAVVLMILYVI